MPSAQELSRLLHTLYAIPTQPKLWPKFLQEFTDFLNLPAAAIMRQDMEMNDGAIEVSVGLDPDAVQLYGAHYHKLDAYRASLQGLPRNDLFFANELCASHELRRTEFFNDFLILHRQALCCGYFISKGPTFVENISLYCDLDTEPPESEIRDRLNLVLPHIRLALRLQRNLVQVEQANSDREAVLNLLATGLILLDENGTCIFLNKAAERIISQRDGLFVRGSSLSAESSREAAQLQSLIKQGAAVAAGKERKAAGAMLIARRGRKPLQVLVSTFLPEKLIVPRRIVVAILIIDPENQPTPSAEILRALYSLTPAESQIAVALSEGKELRRVCDEASITYATGRAHVRNIFSKTGVRRQTELAVLLLREVMQVSGDL
jgi:DNA-binding NarL/FixJ family response regulator